MSRKIPDTERYSLRLPSALRHELEERARAEGRSLNSEIVAILSAAVNDEDIPKTGDRAERRLADLEARVGELQDTLRLAMRSVIREMDLEARGTHYGPPTGEGTTPPRRP